MPSCIRAPPEQLIIITGSWALVAFSNNFVIFSPTIYPILPIRYLVSHTPSITSICPIDAFPVITASSRLVSFLIISFFSLYPGKSIGFLSNTSVNSSTNDPSSIISKILFSEGILKYFPHFIQINLFFSNSFL